ncbi:MAG TPA: LysR family transcriptional regulator, partial [Candidatus Nanopelagicales bacterium]|nr:LysR family transcriptional regulator [Candidatus Nanopelagicales bacterium]
MTDRLSALQVFFRVVETESFSAVARELGLSQPTVSRQVAALEEHLGARLLTRTTRRVAPTDAGRALYERGAR